MSEHSRGRIPEDEVSDKAARSAVESMATSLRESKSFLIYYLTTRADRALLLAKTVAVWTVLASLAALIGVTVLVTASVYLCIGIVGALEQLFGRFEWIGPLLFGIVVLGSVLVGGFIFLKRATGGSKERLVSAYERRQREQRSEFGTDVKREAARSRSN